MKIVKRLVRTGEEDFKVETSHIFRNPTELFDTLNSNPDVFFSIPDGFVEVKYCSKAGSLIIGHIFKHEGFKSHNEVFIDVKQRAVGEVTLSYITDIIRKGKPVNNIQFTTKGMYALFPDGCIEQMPEDGTTTTEALYLQKAYDVYYMDDAGQLVKMFKHQKNAVGGSK